MCWLLSLQWLACRRSYGRRLHHNRVCLTFTIVTEICFLSYIHINVIMHYLSIHKPDLHVLLFLTLMLRQAKLSPKALHQNCITKLATNLFVAKRKTHNLIKISTTNHQQESKLICFLSNPKLLNNTPHTHYEVHCPRPLLYLTLTRKHIQIIKVVPHWTPKRSPPLTTATYTSYHQNQ